MQPIVIKSMHGIGDQFYQRPFIKNLVAKYNGDVYIETFLPEIYSDISGLRFVKPDGETYRTQSKATATSHFVEYHRRPSDSIELNPFYTGNDLVSTSIIHSMKQKFAEFVDCSNLVWDSPHFHNNTFLPDNQKVAIIRPPTVRKEWEVRTRNNHPDYTNRACDMLKEYGYYTISIADLQEDEEVLVGKAPKADLILHEGEFGLFGTLGLMQRADLVVGGSGFIIPATVSFKKPALYTIFGGRMAYDSPYKVFHPSMNMQRIGWSVPDNPCMCTERIHTCDKTIKHFEFEFFKFIGTL